MLTETLWYASSSYSWQTPAGNYTSGSGWTAKAVIIGNVTASIDGVGNGDAFDFSASAAVTGTLTSGSYRVVEQVFSASVVHTLYVTSLTVKPNPLTVGTGYDARSHARKVLDAVEAVIEGRASQVDVSVTIAGRSITKLTITELLKVRQQYKAIVKAEEDAEAVAKGLGRSTTVRVRFVGDGQ